MTDDDQALEIDPLRIGFFSSMSETNNNKTIGLKLGFRADSPAISSR